MTVTSKWVALHEVSDYLAKGWREVQIIGGCDDAALMVSPEEPASEPAKVETTADRIAADLKAGTFRGAQPEPVAAEMPNAVFWAIKGLRDAGHIVSQKRADALESFWRTHAAQPAKVQMTPAVEKILEAYDEANDLLARYLPPDSGISDREVVNGMLGIFDNKTQVDAREAVRAQAAEAGKVRMPPVADIQWALNIAASKAVTMSALEACQRIKKFLAELDAAEGKGEGRG